MGMDKHSFDQSSQGVSQAEGLAHDRDPVGADLTSASALRVQLLNRLIVGQTIAVSLLTVMTAAGALFVQGSDLMPLVYLGALATAVGLVALFFLRRGRVLLASYIFLIGTALAITTNVYTRGLQDAAAIYYLWPILTAAMLLDIRGGLIVAIVSALLYGTLVALEFAGLHVPPLPYNPEEEAFLTVGVRLLMFFLLTFLGALSSRNLRNALRQARQSAGEFRDLSATLERRVLQRTRDLERRARYMQATAAVARDAAAVLGDPQSLLSRVVRLISEQFDFYHAGLFLIDPTGEWAVLQAASSAGGQRMLARGHRLRVGVEGTVGYVTHHGEPRVSLDVGEDAVFFDNPDLPDTHSVITLPLRVRGEVIGALDVQSQKTAAFSDEDTEVLQILADVVAVAINNARLLEQVQQSAERERRALGELTREQWRDMIQSQPDLGFVKERGEILSGRQQWDEEMTQAFQTGKTAHRSDAPAVALPIRVAGQTVAVLDAHLPADGAWLPEQVELLETLSTQIGQALERARLYEQTQRTAARERTIAQVGTRVRESLELPAVLRAAASEIREALGLDKIVVRLAQPEEQE